MIIDVLKDSILQHIGPLKQAPKNWQKRNCFLCHTQGHGKDTRNRFGIQFSLNSIICNCFNCGFSAVYKEGEQLTSSFKFLLRQLNIDEKFIKHIEFAIFKEINQIHSIREGDTETDKDKENKFKTLYKKWKSVDLPVDSFSISQLLENNFDDPNFLKVVNYAINRKIFDLDNFYWSPDNIHNMNMRLIIPYKYKNKIVGYTARLCFDPPDKSIPKYYQQCPTDFIYNLDNQQNWNRKYVILTEGVLDAWVVDGISILGEITRSKIDIINSLQKQIIVCPDRDKKGYDLVKAAIDNKWAVSFPKWDIYIKDAAKAAEKYGRLLTTCSIISSVISDAYKIQINWKIRQAERDRQNT